MYFACSVPDGVSGNWRVETFKVTEEAARFENLRASIGTSSRGISPGVYKRLVRARGGWQDTIMSNTPAEIADLDEFSARIQGSVLINGLGLGIALQIALSKQCVKEVTVIELSKDVINLVAPTYQGNAKVKIINADAFTWEPPRGKKYDVVWHDIWDSICSDNLDGMRKLRKKYARKCRWQGCWCEDEIR